MNVTDGSVVDGVRGAGGAGGSTGGADGPTGADSGAGFRRAAGRPSPPPSRLTAVPYPWSLPALRTPEAELPRTAAGVGAAQGRAAAAPGAPPDGAASTAATASEEPSARRASHAHHRQPDDGD